MTKIFKRDTTGKIRSWDYEVEGDKWRTIAGLEDGKKVVSAWTVATPKNVGKANATTAQQQAAVEARAERELKLDRDYRKTISDVDSVPPSVMLARDYTKEKDKINWNDGVFCQPKLDGIRAMITKHGAFSRDYQQHKNIGHILKVLEPVFAADPSLVLDGELYNHDLRDDFNTVTSLVRREAKSDEERAKAKELIQFHCYDTMSAEPFAKRMVVVQCMLLGIKHIEVVPTGLCDTQDQLDAFYGSYLEEGYEGQMVRNMTGPYESDKRSKYLLKRKEFITDEFPISRVIEGQGNWAGYAKAVEFILPGDKRLENGERPKAGIKGTQEFTKGLLSTAFGKNATVTVKYFTPTPLGIPRFPIAIDFHANGRKD